MKDSISDPDKHGAPDGHRYGLIGYPVFHSLSPAVFGAAFTAAGVRARYDLYEISPEDMDLRVRELVAGGIKGFNVTVPHKMAVIPRIVIANRFMADRNYLLWFGDEAPLEAMREGLEGAMKGRGEA